MPSLLELRLAAGKSRVSVAADLKMSERHLYRLERNASPLRRVNLLAFAHYYGVEPDTISDNEEVAAA